MDMFSFTLEFPPSDQQFEEIAEMLLASLCEWTGLKFHVTARHIEPGSWVTAQIRSHSINERVMNVVFDGILSYSLRDVTPKIESVLLAFSRGKRLHVGNDSILVSNYRRSDTGGKWEDYEWTFDGYGEWECDVLPPR